MNGWRSIFCLSLSLGRSIKTENIYLEWWKVMAMATATATATASIIDKPESILSPGYRIWFCASWFVIFFFWLYLSHIFYRPAVKIRFYIANHSYWLAAIGLIRLKGNIIRLLCVCVCVCIAPWICMNCVCSHMETKLHRILSWIFDPKLFHL